MTIPTRRDFCRQVCSATSALTLGALANACSSPTSPSGSSAPALAILTGTVANRTVTVNVVSGSPLDTVGGMALVQTASGNFLAARTGQTTFSVLTATCTHEACAISGGQSGAFVCPCHGSRFTTSGTVLNGPASVPLRQFTAQFASDVLTFAI